MRRLEATASLFMMFLLAAPAVAQTTAQYTGPTGGLWSNSANWNIGVVPANGGGNTYNVIIPANTMVVFDLSTLTQITGISMESGSSLGLTDTSLEIIGVALLQNVLIEAEGAAAEFLTNAPFVSGASQRARVENGALVRLELSTYVLSNDSLREESIGGPILWADGASSRLDLSSVTAIDASQAGSGCCSSETYTVRASNQGVIDLSNTATLKGAVVGGGINAQLKFRAESGGHINLSGLTDITAGRTWFELAGGTVDLGSLGTAVNMRIDVPIFQTLNLPMLTSTTGSDFQIEAGGTVNAPMLLDFSNSRVTLTPTTFLNAPLFTQIDNARLHVKEGRSFAVADTSYILSNDSLIEQSVGPILSADGAGSLLDLSSLTEIVAQVNSGCCSDESYTIRASNQGVVDLSETTGIAGAGGDGWLKFRAESGGRIDFGSVGYHNGFPGQIYGGVWMDVSGSGSKIVATGDLVLGEYDPISGGGNPPPIRIPRLSASSLGEVHVGGDMIAFINEATFHDTDGGILYMEGSGTQRLEVNGIDNGLPTALIEDNFNWGRLVVGQAGQATTVVLIDGFRFPGNGPPPHALYLSGFPQGNDGLSILGGSTLVLNDLNVYVGAINGNEAEWIHLNSLFGAGENVIPYGDGFLQLTLPVVPGDSDGNGIVDADDYDDWRSAFGNPVFPPGSGADSNGDGIVDAADYTVWRDNLGAATAASSVVLESTRVPEPSTGVLAVVALALMATGFRVARVSDPCIYDSESRATLSAILTSTPQPCRTWSQRWDCSVPVSSC